MGHDLEEIVQLNGRPMSLFRAVHWIMALPPVKRFKGLALFREAGKDPAIFELSDVEVIAQTPEYKRPRRS
jgi:hypothetical protein